MLALPPNAALAFRLSSRASPRTTTRKARPPTRSDSVLAIRPGSTPCTAAASATVAVDVPWSRIAMSGALAARSARTARRVIASSTATGGRGMRLS